MPRHPWLSISLLKFRSTPSRLHHTIRILSMSSQPNDQGRQFRVRLTQDAHEVQYRLVPTGITYDPPAIPIDDRQVRVGNLQRRQFRVGVDLGGGDEHSIS